MRVHSKEKLKKLKELRKRGYSINELVGKLSIPKTTVWHHVHAVKVLSKYIPSLNSKRGGSAKRTRENWEKARERAQELILGSYREFLIILAMLYWGEGSKKVCEFINSDGKMIKIYLTILRKILNISEKDIKATMRIFSGMKKVECLNYWSHITQIPKKRFIIRFNDGGRKGKTRYGMCRITLKKGSNILKLMHSLKEQIFEETIKNLLSPRSSMDRALHS